MGDLAPAWFGLIGTIVGAVIGGVSTYQASLMQFDRESRAERRRLLIEKLEELFALITEMRINYAEVLDDNFKPLVMPTEVFGEKQPRASLKDFQRIDLIVLYYFPNMKRVLDELVESRTQYKTSMNMDKEQLDAAFEKVSRALNNILKACSSEAEKLVKEWGKPAEEQQP